MKTIESTTRIRETKIINATTARLELVMVATNMARRDTQDTIEVPLDEVMKKKLFPNVTFDSISFYNDSGRYVETKHYY